MNHKYSTVFLILVILFTIIFSAYGYLTSDEIDGGFNCSNNSILYKYNDSTGWNCASIIDQNVFNITVNNVTNLYTNYSYNSNHSVYSDYLTNYANLFDQNLNTTSPVQFSNITAQNLSGYLNYSYIQNAPITSSVSLNQNVNKSGNVTFSNINITGQTNITGDSIFANSTGVTYSVFNNTKKGLYLGNVNYSYTPNDKNPYLSVGPRPTGDLNYPVMFIDGSTQSNSPLQIRTSTNGNAISFIGSAVFSVSKGLTFRSGATDKDNINFQISQPYGWNYISFGQWIDAPYYKIIPSLSIFPNGTYTNFAKGGFNYYNSTPPKDPDFIWNGTKMFIENGSLNLTNSPIKISGGIITSNGSWGVNVTLNMTGCNQTYVNGLLISWVGCGA